jgi:hypothetical protein
MLRLADANDETDRRIAEGLAKRTGGELKVLRYSRELKDANRLRELLEVSEDYTGGVSATNRREGAAFFYLCKAPQGQEIAKGEGDSPELAICDGFLDFLNKPLNR